MSRRKDTAAETIKRLKSFTENPPQTLYACSYECAVCGRWIMREMRTLADMKLRRPCKACGERN